MATLGILALSLVGLLLAMAGWLRPMPTALGGLLLLVVLWRISGAADSQRTSGSVWPLLILIVVITVTTALNAKYSSEHLFVDRDPSVYLNTGAWLARHGSLWIDGLVGPFEEASGLAAEFGGFYGIDGDIRLYAQFHHVLPVLLGITWWIGGPWLMFKLNALLGGVALFLFFALARRFMRDWLALTATAALAFNFAQMHFSRDAFAEILTQIFLFGGLWFLYRAWEQRSPGAAFVGGLLIGGTAMARIDGFLFLAALGAFALVTHLSASYRRETGEQLVAMLAACGVGALITSGLGIADLAFYSTGYLRDRSDQVLPMFVAISAVWLLWVVVALVPTPTTLVDLTRRNSSFIGWSAAALVIGTFAFAYFIRPHVGAHTIDLEVGLIGLIQERAGVEIQPSRSYSEMSMRWISWYLGTPVLFLGVLGLAIGVRDIVVGKARALLLFLLSFSVVTLVYGWRPLITPDQVWAIRRFVPITLPGFLLLGFWLLNKMWGATDTLKRSFAVYRLALVLLASLAVALPLRTSLPLRNSTTQIGFYGAVERLCGLLGEDGALVIRGESLAPLSQAVRSFCGNSVALLPPGQPLRVLQNLAGRTGEGRLYLMSEGTHGSACGADPDLVLEFEHWFPQRVLYGAPKTLEQERFAATITDIGPVLSAASYPGPTNGLMLDGLDDYVEIPDDDLLDIQGGLAVELEFATTWRPPEFSSVPITKGEYGGAWWFEYRPNGSLEFWLVADGVPSPVAIPEGLVDDGRLHRVVGVYDGRLLGIYCDGTLLDAQNVSGAIGITDSPVSIGRSFGTEFGSFPFKGFVGEVTLWRFSEADRTEGVPTLPSPSDVQVGLWTFDERQGSLARDMTGNSNSAFIHGATWYRLGADMSQARALSNVRGIG